MQINPYLAFDGNCEEAFKVYHSVLGGHISALYRIGDSPMHAELPKESHNRIMHIRLDVANIGLMGGDSPMGQHCRATRHLRVFKCGYGCRSGADL